MAAFWEENNCHCKTFKPHYPSISQSFSYQSVPLSHFPFPFSLCKICSIYFFIQGFRSPNGCESDHGASAGSPGGEPGGGGPEQFTGKGEEGERVAKSISVWTVTIQNNRTIKNRKITATIHLFSFLNIVMQREKTIDPPSVGQTPFHSLVDLFSHSFIRSHCNWQSTFQRKLSWPHPKAQVWVSVAPC